MAEEQNAFAFGDVVEAITRKMIRRHPHVFADKDGNIDARRRQERLGAHQGRGKGRARGAAAAGRDDAQIAAVGRQGRPAGADARDGIAAQGLHRRLRLERSPRGAAQDPRGGRRDRGGARQRRRGRTRRRNRRSPVRAGQPGAPCRRRSGKRAARHQRQVRTPLCLYRARARGEGPFARGRIARRDGRAVERGEG